MLRCSVEALICRRDGYGDRLPQAPRIGFAAPHERHPGVFERSLVRRPTTKRLGDAGVRPDITAGDVLRRANQWSRDQATHRQVILLEFAVGPPGYGRFAQRASNETSLSNRTSPFPRKAAGAGSQVAGWLISPAANAQALLRRKTGSEPSCGEKCASHLRAFGWETEQDLPQSPGRSIGRNQNRLRRKRKRLQNERGTTGRFWMKPGREASRFLRPYPHQRLGSRPRRRLPLAVLP